MEEIRIINLHSTAVPLTICLRLKPPPLPVFNTILSKLKTCSSIRPLIQEGNFTITRRHRPLRTYYRHTLIPAWVWIHEYIIFFHQCIHIIATNTNYLMFRKITGNKSLSTPDSESSGVVNQTTCTWQLHLWTVSVCQYIRKTIVLPAHKIHDIEKLAHCDQFTNATYKSKC